MKNHDDIQVKVHFMAAGKPFENDYDANATVGQVKHDALIAFGLSEGGTPEGNTVTYILYHEKHQLLDMSQTIGPLAGHQRVLQLKLSQQLTQGSL